MGVSRFDTLITIILKWSKYILRSIDLKLKQKKYQINLYLYTYNRTYFPTIRIRHVRFCLQNFFYTLYSQHRFTIQNWCKIYMFSKSDSFFLYCLLKFGFVIPDRSIVSLGVWKGNIHYFEKFDCNFCIWFNRIFFNMELFPFSVNEMNNICFRF